MILLLFRCFAVALAGFVLAASATRIYQWFPLRRKVGLGPSLFFAGAFISAASSLWYRITAITASSAFSARDAISTVILSFFLAGLLSSPVVLAELETKGGDA